MKEKILSLIDENEIVELLKQFVKIPSVSGDEANLAKFDYDTCKKFGMNAQIDRHGNLIATFQGKKPGPKIALNSHLDTVGFGDGWTKDPTGAEIEGDYLYGRGSADCKASMVAHIIATKALMQSGAELGGEIAITHPVEEEVQNAARKGTYKMMKDGFKADMAINGEATSNTICLACCGMLEVVVTTIGKRAHGSTPKEGVNAIDNMMKIIERLNKIQPGYNKYTGDGTIVPGVIRGGERSSVVPDFCELKVSRFIVPGENGPMFYAQVLGIIAQLQAEDPKFAARAELVYESRPSLISEEEAVVKHMIDAFSDMNLSHIISGTPQHDDADYLVNMGNIPTVIFGPGDGKVAHTPDECVSISQVVEATKIYALTLYHAMKVSK